MKNNAGRKAGFTLSTISQSLQISQFKKKYSLKMSLKGYILMYWDENIKKG